MDGYGSARLDDSRNGYSLLEAVVALTIVGMAILVASNALQSHAALLHRTAVREQLLHRAEDVLEELRGGVLALDGGTVVEVDSRDRTARGRATIAVEPLDVEGLYRVTVMARTAVSGEPLAVELTTMVWRP